MLHSSNLMRKGVYKVMLCVSTSNIISRFLTLQFNIQYRKHIGYFIVCSNIYSKINNNLIVTNYKLLGNCNLNKCACSQTEVELTAVQFEKISNETLESLTEYFDELIERATHLPDADVSYGDGVLNVKFGHPYGTYVLNRQTPNKQIWLSSPKSGPKRYDFVNGKWIYKHDGKTLHELLNNEISAIIRDQTNFDKCSFSGKEREAAMKAL